MVEQTKAFIDKLENDTLVEKLTWHYISELDKDIFSTNESLATILSSYAHHYIFEDQSFYAELTSPVTVYLVYRRIMSGKDGTISTNYEFYIQENELGPCITVEASQEALAKLATIIKSMTPIEKDKSTLSRLINNYLGK